MISPIHYIYTTGFLSLKDYVYGWMTGLFAWISLTVLSQIYFIRKTKIYINVQNMKPGIALHEFIHGQFIAWVGIIYYQMTIKKGWVSDFVKRLNQFGLIRILVNLSCELRQIMIIRYDFIFEWLWEILQQIPIWPVRFNFWSIFLVILRNIKNESDLT